MFVVVTAVTLVTYTVGITKVIVVDFDVFYFLFCGDVYRCVFDFDVDVVTIISFLW